MRHMASWTGRLSAGGSTGRGGEAEGGGVASFSGAGIASGVESVVAVAVAVGVGDKSGFCAAESCAESAPGGGVESISMESVSAKGANRFPWTRIGALPA